MKKIILALILALVGVASSYAETDVWGKGRFTRIGYSWSQTAVEDNPVYDGKFGFFLVKGTTYHVHRNPIAKILKFGIDATWMDIQFSKYKSPTTSGNWTSEIDETIGADDEDGGDFNIGHMALSYSFEVGPSVSVAPFLLLNNAALSHLKANLYFHYAPTFTAYLASQDGDMEFAGAYVNNWTFGGNIVYRWIGIGIEGRWGSGKFKPVAFDSEGLGTDKYKRKFANTRLYVQFTF